jgi:hypothetical protein
MCVCVCTPMLRVFCGVCVYMYVCMYVCVYIYIYIHTHTHINDFMNLSVHQDMVRWVYVSVD